MSRLATQRQPAAPPVPDRLLAACNRLAAGMLLALDRAGAYRRTCVVGIGCLTVVLRLALLPWFPIPTPAIHDEFSYLLAADTFASGRLTNPPHALPEFFEAPHVLMRPTYQSKYPPGQPLFLALGQVVFGNPYFGVILTVALLTAAFCWMLQAWVPPGWAFAGGLLSVALFGVGHYWMLSYWGGSVAAFASALLIGSWRRIAQWERTSCAWALAVALVLLFWTRPYEGGVLALAVGAHLLWRFRRRPNRGALLGRMAVPIALVCLPAGIFQARYDRAVTGSWTTLPYLEYTRQYQVVPLFWMGRTPPPKHCETDGMRREWQWEIDRYREARQELAAGSFNRVRALDTRILAPLEGVVPFLVPLLPVVAILPDPGLRLLLFPFALSTLGMSLETFVQLHYMAPLMALALVMALRACWRLRAFSWRRQRIGTALAAGLLIFWFAASVYQGRVTLASAYSDAALSGNVGHWRAAVERQLRQAGGRHVVLVHQAPAQAMSRVWTYNRADIDGSPVVWAVDRGPENRRLLDYYPGRRFWLLDADARPPRLTPYGETR